MAGQIQDKNVFIFLWDKNFELSHKAIFTKIKKEGFDGQRQAQKIEIIDTDHIVITAYNISPAGEEAEAVETRYSRKSG